jgi:hypothetical protein
VYAVDAEVSDIQCRDPRDSDGLGQPDVNVSKLETIEQIREFLDDTSDVAFSNPTDASALRTSSQRCLGDTGPFS